jgi:hypothetical protein
MVRPVIQEKLDSQLLHRERIIRYLGVVVAFSPIGNLLWSATAAKVQWWHFDVMSQVLRGLGTWYWLQSALSMLAGLLMIKGKRSSWTFTLCVIGGSIVGGLATLKHDFHEGWFQACLPLAANSAFFGLIYAQEFHQRLEKRVRETARLTRSFSQEFAPDPGRAVKVEFEGFGPWAEIIQITQDGFRVRTLKNLIPQGIESQIVEIALSSELLLQARFAGVEGEELLFRFVDLDSSSYAHLRRWSKARAARCRRLAS